MKKSMVNSVVYILLLLMFGSVIAHAKIKSTRTTPPLQFQTTPVVQDIKIGAAQTITFTVKNKVTTEPLQIHSVAFSPASGLFKQASTNNCHNLVPKNGTCKITLRLKSLGTAGTVKGKIVINYGARHAELISQSLQFKIVDPSAGKLIFTAQASAHNMSVNSTQTLSYTVKNTSKTKPVIMNSIALVPGSTIVTEQISGSCKVGKSLAAGHSCTIIITITSGSTTGTVTGQVLIRYNQNRDTLLSNTFSFKVEATSNKLVFIKQGQPSNMSFNSRQQVNYTVFNKSKNTVTLSSVVAVPPSNLVTETTSNNCNNTIHAGKTCIITLTITSATTPGTVAQALIIHYTIQGTVQPQLLTSTPFTFHIQSQGLELSFLIQNTPNNMTPNSEQTVSYTVINNSTVNTITLGTIFATPNSALVTEHTSNQCSGTLLPQGTCVINLDITSSSQTGTVNQSLVIDYSDNVSGHYTLTSDPFTFSISTGRVITFVNQCNVPIWFGVSGGAVNSKQSAPDCQTTNSCVTTCDTDDDCYANTKCYASSATENQCFSVNFAPANGNYELQNPSDHNTIVIPIPTTDINFQDIIWSGTFAPRTACSGTACETASCTNTGAATGACTPGVGFTPPNTLAEITMLRTAADTYDVSLIGGFNIPMSVTPSVAQSGSNPYTCGAAGGTTASLGLGACSWDFSNTGSPPPSNNYVYVQSGGTSPCPASCPSGQVCGVTLENMKGATNKTPVKSCGKFLGYWSSDAACGLNSTIKSPFFCNQNAGMGGSFTNATLTNLYLCNVGIPSCYTAGSVSNQCCGCINWQNKGVPVPEDNNIVQQCQPPSTPKWNTIVLNTLTWLKKACPRAYVYPFDDKSSTFTCGSISEGVNQVDYTVTFCPS